MSRLSLSQYFFFTCKFSSEKDTSRFDSFYISNTWPVCMQHSHQVWTQSDTQVNFHQKRIHQGLTLFTLQTHDLFACNIHTRFEHNLTNTCRKDTITEFECDLKVLPIIPMSSKLSSRSSSTAWKSWLKNLEAWCLRFDLVLTLINYLSWNMSKQLKCT